MSTLHPLHPSSATAPLHPLPRSSPLPCFSSSDDDEDDGEEKLQAAFRAKQRAQQRIHRERIRSRLAGEEEVEDGTSLTPFVEPPPVRLKTRSLRPSPPSSLTHGDSERPQPTPELAVLKGQKRLLQQEDVDHSHSLTHLDSRPSTEPSDSPSSVLSAVDELPCFRVAKRLEAVTTFGPDAQSASVSPRTFSSPFIPSITRSSASPSSTYSPYLQPCSARSSPFSCSSALPSVGCSAAGSPALPSVSRASQSPPVKAGRSSLFLFATSRQQQPTPG